ncbi:hypothetical protein GDO81_004368 [Engystomops pustulosus]|uniref:Beta-microseminoprotein-like n=2 Tax=Engystomops pustulosus TaxID=76066 RepID=A0AAV6ZS28_ENGPU|nr:hypothetical protein GDO81_004368 [Engystomops pustulosus]
MAYLLHILVAVTMISLCHGQCVTEMNGKMGHEVHNQKIYPLPKDGCTKDGKSYQVGDSWASDDCCFCTCYHYGVTCCAKFAKPILKDPINCTTALNMETCKYDVKRKDNSEEMCEVESWVA